MVSAIQFLRNLCRKCVKSVRELGKKCAGFMEAFLKSSNDHLFSVLMDKDLLRFKIIFNI